MDREEEDDDFTHALVDGKSGRPEVTVALTTGVSPVSSHARCRTTGVEPRFCSKARSVKTYLCQECMAKPIMSARSV